MSTYTVGFIGGGNMARALVGGLISSGYRPENILIAEPNLKRRSVLTTELPGVRISDSNDNVADSAECLV
ncbi:MAG: NAD(P)-binding domain-containing protein, partial [Gammaproteobacteria bacterium]|nr:NAD(P)-binding domain-containing protein [Gammaproteobacteria bacterium]